MPRPDEGLIHAWLDGELDDAEAARVAKLVATDAEWGAAAAEARGLIAASSRIVQALDAVPAGVIPAGSKAAGAPPRRFMVRSWMRVAATLVLVAGLGYAVSRDGTTDVARNAASAEAPAATGPGATAVPQESIPAAATRSATPSAPPAPPAPATPPAPRLAIVRDSAPQRGEAERREVAKTVVTAQAPALVVDTIAPPAAPTVLTRAPAAAAGAGAKVAATDDARTRAATLGASARDAREPAPTARFAPRQVIERAEPSALAERDAFATTGCWRARTTAPFDTLLLEPRLTPERGDTLRLEVSQRNVSARVVFVGANTLSGTATDSLGRRHPFSATRVSCP